MNFKYRELFFYGEHYIGVFSRIVAIILALLLSFTLYPPSSNADEDPKELLIGVVPDGNVFKQYKRYSLLVDHISEKTGVKIKIGIFSSYGDIIDNFDSHKLDGAFFESFTGVVAHEKFDVEATARPVTPDGKSTYHGHILVRKDSGIRSVHDMRGKVMVFVDRASSCAYIYPLAYLKEHGVNDIDSFFKEYYFAGGHDAVIHGVLDGTADIGVAKNTVYDAMSKTDPRLEKELMILDESPEFASHGLFVRSALSPVLKRRLRDTLLETDLDPPGILVLQKFGAVRFIKTDTHKDYHAVFEVAEKAGIDLKTYKCNK